MIQWQGQELPRATERPLKRVPVRVVFSVWLSREQWEAAWTPWSSDKGHAGLDWRDCKQVCQSAVATVMLSDEHPHTWGFERCSQFLLTMQVD